uniref:WW domain binding protein 1 n=1 Tax=Oryzias latipes TaxID=8090 RepID=A0A3P9J0M8_ORYLA
MPQKAVGSIVGLLCTGTCLVEGKEFCFGVTDKEYRCEMGYCCADSQCCTYYYELWWFWLVWTLIIMLSCCCAYRHRRVKMRLQQEQRQREISLMAYQGASSSFISPPPLNLRFWNDCKLPDYEEVVGHPPTPPPPYSENPPESAPALPPQLRQTDASFVQQPPPQAQSGVASSSSSSQEVSVLPPQAQRQAEGNAEEDEELVTRRRHVTGDSGIEVCVCQLDVCEGSGLEEESGAEHRTCNMSNRDCCSASQQEPLGPKEGNSDMPGQTGSGDHMV